MSDHTETPETSEPESAPTETVALSTEDRPPVVPAELPVLPLRDTVLFPNSFMPLAVARESSVRLIDEAIANNKLIGVFAQRDPALDEPIQADLYPVGTATHIHKMFRLPDGSLRLIVQGLSRIRLDEVIAVRPYLRATVTAVSDELRDEDRLEIDALLRNIKSNFQKVVSLSPLLSDDLQTLALNIEEPARLADFIASSLSTISTAIKQDVLETLDVRARMDNLNRILIKELEVLELGLEDSVAGAVGGRTQPARVLPARADEGDSEGAGRRRRAAERDRGASREDRGRGHAGSGAERGRPRARPAVADARRGGRIHRVAHLSRLARRAALEQANRRGDRPSEDEAGSRRRAFRAGEGQGSHPRIPRGAQAESRGQGADSLLRRASGRRQDVAGAIDCQLARAQVRARLAGWHARRGRNSRPPAHVHRCPAWTGRPGAAPRRVEEPGLHPGRDRQAGVGFPRRSELGAARSARPGTERHLPRPLSRRAVRSLGGALHHDCERARSDSAAAPRSHGSAGAARLHGGGKARNRARAPGREAGARTTASRPR